MRSSLAFIRSLKSLAHKVFEYFLRYDLKNVSRMSLDSPVDMNDIDNKLEAINVYPLDDQCV